MKSFTRLAVCFSLLLAGLTTFSQLSSAGTVELTGVDGTSAGGVFTGLYSLTENGKPTLAFCDDFDTHTFIGETWTANANNLSNLGQLKFNASDDPGALSSNFLKDYQAEIYLGQLLANTPASNPQQINDLSFAIWGIFSANARASSAYDAAALAFDNAALARNYAPGQFSNWVIWTPNPTSSSQEFINPSTPEPSALLLFGSGLLGLTFFVRRLKQRPVTT
jgi:hypothetical protein